MRVWNANRPSAGAATAPNKMERLRNACDAFSIKYLANETERLAEKARRLEEMLAYAANRAACGELTDGIVHDLNNPIGIIMATSGVIRDMLTPEFELDHSPEAICQELSIIDAAVNRAKSITGQFREVGKRHEPPGFAPCVVNALLDEALEMIGKEKFSGQHIEIKKEYSAALPEIQAAPAQLRRVFGEILVNAREATTGVGQVTIKTESRDDGVIHVIISDTGKGIAADDLPWIFHPFFTTKMDENVGLGLSIAASIMRDYGGAITADSEVGLGSVFTIMLPVDGRRIKLKS
jgi:two-component system NtrC family sensor kinase